MCSAKNKICRCIITVCYDKNNIIFVKGDYFKLGFRRNMVNLKWQSNQMIYLRYPLCNNPLNQKLIIYLDICSIINQKLHYIFETRYSCSSPFKSMIYSELARFMFLRIPLCWLLCLCSINAPLWWRNKNSSYRSFVSVRLPIFLQTR